MEPIAAPATPLLAQGQILDGAYEIGPVLGRGGMATVYEGRSLESGQLFAVKMLRDGGEERSEAQRRFFNELLLASSLRHPRIVEVHDFGVSPEGARYLVMERLRGHTVGQELRRFGRMDPRRSVPRLLEAVDALELAHSRGIIHSDLKPTNLFLRDPGTAHESLTVLDFGVAHRMDGKQSGHGGTPRYAPPELLTGGPTLPATDVYQLGMVLAEMLAGEAVLHGVTTIRQCLEAHAAGRVPLPLSLLDSDFREVVETAVSLDPRRRFRDAGELREALVFAWLRHQSGSRSFPTGFDSDGSLEDENHTERFQDDWADPPEDQPPLLVEAPPAPAERPSTVARAQVPVGARGWVVALAVSWALALLMIAVLAALLGAIVVLG